MIENPNATYGLNMAHYDIGYDAYMNFEKTFGDFSNEGRTYTVTDRNTPRQWMHFLVNDRFASVACNDGSGFIALDSFYYRITKFYCASDYLIRTLNGKRRIILEKIGTNVTYDLLSDCENMTFTTEPGIAVYEGSMGDGEDAVSFRVEIFVPSEDACECWTIALKGNGTYKLTVGEDLAFLHMYRDPKTAGSIGDVQIETMDGGILAVSEKSVPEKNTYSIFAMEGSTASMETYSEDAGKGEILTYTKVDLSKEITLGADETIVYVTAGADYDKEICVKMYEKYKDRANVAAAKQEIIKKWDSMIAQETCDIPDKNLQYFLNIWLKNQVYLTMRYNRFDIMGYRDVMQDSWGHLLVNPNECKHLVLEGLSKMYGDGRCPRQYDRFSDMLDDRDFMDSPIWIPLFICDYIKETGDYGILEEEVGYLFDDKVDTVLDHILLSLDYLYHSRGKNGLILMRRGDWFDGLNGINAHGEATTVWGTMAAFYAQNLMVELLNKIGKTDLAQMLTERSAEYKEIVNTVGWDGNWYTYAFIDDEPIGGSACHEGKIYANAQSWAMLTGICDDQKRIDKMNRSVATYLSSPYGPHLLAPPYIKYGARCGRVQNQRPGTFGNSAIYLHAAAFMAYAQCARGKYDDALDLLQRILPGHSDNNDSRRTSEPYCIGNVYYGVTHPCHGLNLFAWFTATPSWVIHCGFEDLLGVKADYDGLKITAHDIDGWDTYSVTKLYRGTKYVINFKRGDEKGIFVDGVKQESNIVISENETCEVVVVY